MIPTVTETDTEPTIATSDGSVGHWASTRAMSEPLRPAITEFLFSAAAMQMQLEQPIVARKALFKGLGPGRYEVRVNKQIRVVEIVAGKTMELDFDKKLPPPLPDPAPEPKPKQ